MKNRQGEKVMAKEMKEICESNIVTDLNNCYCEATEEHYDSLIDDGFLDGSEDEIDIQINELMRDSLFILIYPNDNKIFQKTIDLEDKFFYKEDRIKIKLNSNNEWVYMEEDLGLNLKGMDLSLGYFKKITDEYYKGFGKDDNTNINCNTVSSDNVSNTIQIKDGNKVYSFENPDFECELLKVINDDGIATDRIVGIVKHKDLNEWTSRMWWVDGICVDNERMFCLEPIKPKCDCIGWARTFEETLISNHAPHCPNRDIEKEAKEHLSNIVEALEYEGNQGDGINEEFFEKYENAKFFIGQKVKAN